MKNSFSRRRFTASAFLAGGLTLLPALASAQPDPKILQSNPMFPEHYMKVLGFFDETDVDWYEKTHAPDFLSFAAPYMARHARNWIQSVEFGEAPVGYNVITELRFKDEAAKVEVRRLMFSAPGLPLLTRTAQHDRERKKAFGSPTGPKTIPLFSVEPRIAKPISEGVAPSTTQRRVVLLRRTEGTEQAAFEAACDALVQQITRKNRKTVASLDVFGSNPQPGPADAVIYVANAGSVPLSLRPRRELTVRSIFRVETRSSLD